MRKRFAVGVIVLAMLIGIFGPVSAQGKVITIDFQQELDTLNPIYTGMWFMTTAADLYLAPPWFIDDNLEPVPVLVTEIPSADNEKLSGDKLAEISESVDKIFQVARYLHNKRF